MKRALMIRASCVAMLLAGCGTLGGGTGSRETSVCGAIKEPMVFAIWSMLAGKPAPAFALQIDNVEAISYETLDGRVLNGYRVNSRRSHGSALGALLVAQGNAMLSDRVVSSLTDFAAAGLDVYVFDYRGYGNSEGRRRFDAIIHDYSDLFEHVSRLSPGKRLLYGISFGGIVTANLIGRGVEFDRAVIDSSPSRVSPLGCPERYDPVRNLPTDSSRLMIVVGEQDRVVTIAASKELVDRAASYGANTDVRSEFAHPFMDATVAIHRERLRLIRSFLLH